MELLKFGYGNAKLNKTIITFTLPAGTTCPFAKECKAWVEIKNGTRRILDGPNQKYRCYQASLEALRKVVYENAHYNFNLLKNKSENEMYKLIKESLPPGYMYRIHVGGDFFSYSYFKAWMRVIKEFPNRIFYCYTKAVRYILLFKNKLPKNFKYTCSLGGLCDDLALESKLKYVKVIYSPEEAGDLEIDHDDSHALGDKSFAVLIHGSQPKNSDANKAIQELKNRKIKFSYGRK